MTDTSPSPQVAQNTRGIVLMLVAMALFAIADAFLKLSAGVMGPGLTALWIMAGSAIVFACIARAQGHRLWHPALKSPAVLGRAAAETVGSFGMITAFAFAPLSTTIAILQASPLVVTAMAAMFLGETVGWRRWSAVAVGFVGVLLIVRPGTEGFNVALLWAVLGTIGLSARDFFTRLTPRDVPTTVLSAFTIAAVVPSVFVWALMEGGGLIPEDPNWFWIVGMIGFGCGGYFAITQAMRVGDISAVAPFRYSRLIFAGILGVAIFGERPDIWMIAGSMLILASGLYAMLRERNLSARRTSD
ncbi:MAG: DMT family transporter [Pseudomonadota bacterium]